MRGCIGPFRRSLETALDSSHSATQSVTSELIKTKILSGYIAQTSSIGVAWRESKIRLNAYRSCYKSETRRELGDNIKIDFRKTDYEDEMDGGWNWLKIVTIRGFDFSVFCCQGVFGWFVNYLVTPLVNQSFRRKSQLYKMVGPRTV